MFPLSSFATSKPEQWIASEGSETINIQIKLGKFFAFLEILY